MRSHYFSEGENKCGTDPVKMPLVEIDQVTTIRAQVLTKIWGCIGQLLTEIPASGRPNLRPKYRAKTGPVSTQQLD